MNLEMIRVPHRERLVCANSAAHAGALRKCETCFGPAQSPLQLEHSPFCAEWRIDAVEIVKRLTVLQRAVIAPGWRERCLRSKANVLVEHHVSAESQEKAVQAGSRLAERIAGPGYATAESIRR